MLGVERTARRQALEMALEMARLAFAKRPSRGRARRRVGQAVKPSDVIHRLRLCCAGSADERTPGLNECISNPWSCLTLPANSCQDRFPSMRGPSKSQIPRALLSKVHHGVDEQIH